MATSFIPAQTGLSRVFLIEGRARPDHEPDYVHQFKAMSLEQSFGDVENIYTPHPDVFDKFLVVGSVRAEEERPTTQLQGRYALDLASDLLRLAKIGCANDVHIHFGDCTNPADFNEFRKIVVMEEAHIPNWATDDVGALQPDEKASILETADISAVSLFEILPRGFAERAGDIITNQVNDVVICDQIQCGECDELSDGCQKIYMVTNASGGSPSTPPDIVWSLDGGSNFFARDIDTMTSGSAIALACVKQFTVALESGEPRHHFVLKDEMVGAASVLNWAEITTYNDNPTDIWSNGNVAFMVGEGGFVWRMTDPTVEAPEVDAGVATSDDLRAVHGIGDEFAVAVGDNGAIVYTETGDGTIWQAAPSSPVGAGIALISVAVKDENEWLVGTDDGRLFFTVDKAVTWILKGFPGSGSGTTQDIEFSNDTVVYLAHNPAGDDGRILRSYNGGFDWNIVPETSSQLPDNQTILSLAACQFDPNFLVAVGLGPVTDGIVLIGED